MYAVGSFFTTLVNWKTPWQAGREIMEEREKVSILYV